LLDKKSRSSAKDISGPARLFDRRANSLIIARRYA
jgi:hypothetical protein